MRRLLSKSTFGVKGQIITAAAGGDHSKSALGSQSLSMPAEAEDGNRENISIPLTNNQLCRISIFLRTAHYRRGGRWMI